MSSDGSGAVAGAFDPASDTLELRAERAGTGDGRTYTVTLTATDASGNEATASFTVLVPRSEIPSGLEEGIARQAGGSAASGGASTRESAATPSSGGGATSLPAAGAVASGRSSWWRQRRA